LGELLLPLNTGEIEKVRVTRYRTARKIKLAGRTGFGGGLFSEGYV
jgi:hypothetical protein